jgi:hypothetical protein
MAHDCMASLTERFFRRARPTESARTRSRESEFRGWTEEQYYRHYGATPLASHARGTRPAYGSEEKMRIATLGFRVGDRSRSSLSLSLSHTLPDTLPLSLTHAA